jgi:hypothetical protein
MKIVRIVYLTARDVRFTKPLRSIQLLFIGHLTALFHLQRLYRAEYNSKIIRNDKYVRIWKEVVTTYFRVPLRYLSGLNEENNQQLRITG